VKECSRLAQEAVRDGMCVVIGLQSTGEANTSSERTAKGDELDDFVSVRTRLFDDGAIRQYFVCKEVCSGGAGHMRTCLMFKCVSRRYMKL